MSIKDENLRIALIKTFADALADYMKDARADHLNDLLDLYEAGGIKSFNVSLPDGSKVGTITLPEGKPKDDIVDGASLFEWAEPLGGVITDELPAVPARKEKRIDRAWLDEKIKKALPGDDGELIDAETGEPIPGVKRIPGAAPSSFTIRYEKDGRERIATAYRRGELNRLVAGTVLPQIDAPKAAAA